MSRITNWWGIRHVLSSFRRVWDFLTIDRLFRVLILSMLFSLCLTTYNTAQVQRQQDQIHKATETLTGLVVSNRKTLTIVETQTSPEAIARQKAQVEDIIGIIDCNQRQALQDALQGLVERGILDPADVVTITRACEQQQLQNTTTTTTPSTTTTTLGE